jgi:hypothetical protein
MDKCEKQFTQCNKRIGEAESDIKAVTDPKDGALTRVHEKINAGLSARPKTRTLLVFVGVFAGLLFTSISGSYIFTYASTEKIEAEIRGLLTQKDFKEFTEKQEKFNEKLLEKIDGLKK